MSRSISVAQVFGLFRFQTIVFQFLFNNGAGLVVQFGYFCVRARIIGTGKVLSGLIRTLVPNGKWQKKKQKQKEPSPSDLIHVVKVNESRYWELTTRFIRILVSIVVRTRQQHGTIKLNRCNQMPTANAPTSLFQGKRTKNLAQPQ